MSSFLTSFVATLSSLSLAARFHRRLSIRPSEIRRYLTKCINLSLCYAAFVRDGGIRGAARAGKAAFLCCAYDVVTDWRHFDARFKQIFLAILDETVPAWAAKITTELYDSEVSNALKLDGLERGVYAVRFIVGLVDSKAHFERFGIERLGILLQLADDILDMDDDFARGELNCLASAGKAHYIFTFLQESDGLGVLFQDDRIMRLALQRAASAAAALLEKTGLPTASQPAVHQTDSLVSEIASDPTRTRLPDRQTPALTGAT